ncbi:energy-coupling factor transporter transmembrane component T [Bacillus gobiensis]|uniref:energy-coupling factor transporter transmembrane component T n=1 Tax=Bacillus gobiensis TaxID=1441095 RepID=UPI003D1A4B69
MFLYHNTNSIFHYLNGFTKIILFLVLAPIMLFSADTLAVLFMLFLLLAGMLISTKPESGQLIILYPAFIVSLFMSISLFFGHFEKTAVEEVYLFTDLKIIDFSITSTNLIEASRSFMKLLGTSFACFILLFTTTPRDLIAGMRKAKIPEVIILVLSLTLRFWGVMIEDVKKVINAQYCRGINFKDKNLFIRIKNFLSIITPLIYILIKRSQITGLALTLKGYGSTNKRTVYYNPALTLLDKRAFIISIVLVITFVGYSVLSQNQ